jgi:hypothetical protein
MIKMRASRWAGNVARMNKKKNVNKGLVWKPKGRDHSEDLTTRRMIILKWILN